MAIRLIGEGTLRSPRQRTPRVQWIADILFPSQDDHQKSVTPVEIVTNAKKFARLLIANTDLLTRKGEPRYFEDLAESLYKDFLSEL